MTNHHESETDVPFVSEPILDLDAVNVAEGTTMHLGMPGYIAVFEIPAADDEPTPRVMIINPYTRAFKPVLMAELNERIAQLTAETIGASAPKQLPAEVAAKIDDIITRYRRLQASDILRFGHKQTATDIRAKFENTDNNEGV